jgi:hypothetical protein
LNCATFSNDLFAIFIIQNRPTTGRGKHTHKNQKINEKRKQQKKRKWKRAKYNHVQENSTKTAKQIPSGI